MNWMLLVQFAVDGAFAGEQKEQLVGAVDGAPVEAQAGHQFEDLFADRCISWRAEDQSPESSIGSPQQCWVWGITTHTDNDGAYRH